MLLCHGANVNSVDLKNGINTLLHVAALQPNIEVVKLLLSHGANKNIDGLEGSILHSAAIGGSKKVITTLLKHGAKVEIDLWGNSPLHFVTTREATIILLKNGDKENRMDYRTGTTPLHNAAKTFQMWQ